MRQNWILAAVAAAAFSVSPATAASKKDIASCTQSSDFELKGAACTRVINSKPSSALRFWAHNERCISFFERLDFDRALADCNEAIRIDPKQFAAYHNRGTALMLKGDYDGAIAEYSMAVRLEPTSAMSYALRGRAWQEKNIFEPAMADLHQAVRLNQKDPDIYVMRASVWRELGEYDKALADDNQAVRLNPKFAMGYASRGASWRYKGDLDRALADQNKAVQLDPKNSEHYIRRGDTLRYRGELDRALADYDQSLALRSGSIAALAGRGLTLERMGDFARARVEFERATTSQHPLKAGLANSGMETARARLAALDSGAPQPVILAAPSQASSATSIPTPDVAIPRVVSQKPAQGRRVALVIGNSAYKSVPALANPQRDADAIAKSLRAIGFETVTLASDASREKLVDALRTFANEVEKADWAVVYYAGHGIEVNGVNYMIPVDAKLAADRDVQFEAVPLDQVMASVEGAKKLRLVLLDACRDNPFAPQMRKTAAPAAIAANTAGGTVGTRSVSRGLGEVKVVGATLVVYAAKHGQTALDGEGGNSPFAVAVVQRLATPNVEINKLFRLVRDDVMEATAGRQEPYTYGSLPGREDFFFVQR